MKHDCTALVVDDEPAVCHLVRHILSGFIARVHVAAAAGNALEILSAESVDLLFVDLHLDDSSGLQLLQSALHRRPDLATVVITGYATLESAIDALRLGACDYLVKPFDKQTILASLERALLFKRFVALDAGKRPHDPQALPVTLVAASALLRSTLEDARSLADARVPVLVEGESGVGKQALARWMHAQSSAPNEPFVRFFCGTLKDARPGSEPCDWRRFIASPSTGGTENWGASGTFYADRVNELPLWAQRQLLEKIEAGWPLAIGSTAGGPNARIIASAATSLEEDMAKGTLLRGLYDLLRGTSLAIAPLRKRPEDIRALVYHFLDRFCLAQKRDAGLYRRAISEETWLSLLRYAWPGNVRELIGLLATALLHNSKNFDQIVRRHTFVSVPALSCETVSVPVVGDMRTIEQCVIREVLRRCGGNKAAAARALGMHRRTLYRVLGKRKRADMPQTVSSEAHRDHEIV